MQECNLELFCWVKRMLEGTWGCDRYMAAWNRRFDDRVAAVLNYGIAGLPELQTRVRAGRIYRA